MVISGQITWPVTVAEFTWPKEFLSTIKWPFSSVATITVSEFPEPDLSEDGDYILDSSGNTIVDSEGNPITWS